MTDMSALECAMYVHSHDYTSSTAAVIKYRPFRVMIHTHSIYRRHSIVCVGEDFEDDAIKSMNGARFVSTQRFSGAQPSRLSTYSLTTLKTRRHQKPKDVDCVYARVAKLLWMSIETISIESLRRYLERRRELMLSFWSMGVI